MRRLLFILLQLGFFYTPYMVSAQPGAIDSLRNIIDHTADDTKKLSDIYLLLDQPINADTLYKYVIIAEEIASKTKSIKETDKVGVLRANYYIRKNYIDSALTLVNKLIEKYKNDETEKKGYLSLLFIKAKALDRGNRYTQALTQLYEVVETAQLQQDTLIQIQAKTGIGWVQMEMEQYREALRWLYNAMHTSANQKFFQNYGALYSNIASCYNSLGQPDSARVYINIAINDARKNNNLVFLATALSMQARIFINSKQPHLAEAPLYEVVEIRKQLNDPFYTVYDMSSLASYYASNHQTAKGIELCKEGIVLAKKSGLSSQLLMMYHALAENYKASGNIAAYSNTLESIIALKDSFNSLNSTKLLADMQAASDARKKEHTIAEQKLTLTRKNSWLIGSALFAVMAGIIAWLGFTMYRRKQKLRMEIALAEEKRIAARLIIDAEEQERKRIAADLHDNIGAYASAIRADVEKITDHNRHEKNNPAFQNLQQHSQEIINSLRDTIWVLNKENITITGISDRIKNYINKLQPSYNNILINVDEQISNDIRISSKHALNIFRIVQEAIHNALKHSDADKITVHVESSEILLISITDNGKGITKGINGDGNGLQNMQLRARETGMQLSINTAANAGTALVLHNGTTN